MPRRNAPPHARACAGFTLVEVLVALGIAALALGAGLQAAGALTRNAQRQGDVLLAQLCADNELVRQRLSRQLPGTGENRAPCEQARQTLQVVTSVHPTPNPNFRRIDTQVLQDATPVLQLSTILGRY
jgi:general secretion pathway protein I